MYFVVKVTSGQEKIAANMLQNKASKGDSSISSIIVVIGMGTTTSISSTVISPFTSSRRMTLAL